MNRVSNWFASHSTEIGVGMALTTVTMAVLAETVMGVALPHIEYIAVGGGFGSLGLAKWLEGKRPKTSPGLALALPPPLTFPPSGPVTVIVSAGSAPAARPLPPKLPSPEWSEEDASNVPADWIQFYSGGQIDLTRWQNDEQLSQVGRESGFSIKPSSHISIAFQHGKSAILFTAMNRKWILHDFGDGSVTIRDPIHRTLHVGSLDSYNALEPSAYLLVTRDDR